MQQPTARILAACKDMGGANILLPVVKRLRQEKFDTTLIGYETSEAFFRQKGIAFNTISDFGLSQANEKSMAELISKTEPSLVLLGTSANKSIEKPLTEAARKQGIKTLAILDFWSNYRKRFVVDSDKDFENYAPDYLAVMSQFAKTEATASGFRPGKVFVVGQPHFDSLQLVKSCFKKEEAAAFKKSLGIAAEQKVILFLSQKSEETYGSRQESEAALGFSQTLVMQLLVKSLQRIGERHGKKFVLVIKPHPAEDLQKFSSFEKMNNPTIIVARKAETRQAILSSDFVVGMDSITLFEALFFGKPVLSLQPNLKKPDRLNFGGKQVIETVCSEKLIQPSLEKFLFQKSALDSMQRNRDFFIKALAIDGKATDRVLRFVKRLLNSKKTGKPFT